MRYAAAEKLEIIRQVEQSSLSVRRTLDQLGIPRSTFYCWYDRYRTGQTEDLKDRSPTPGGCGTSSRPQLARQCSSQYGLAGSQVTPRIQKVAS